MNQDELRPLSHKMAVEMTNSPQTFLPIDGSHDVFLTIGAYFLGHYGGSLSESFLLHHYQRMLRMSEMDLRHLVAKMEFNPRLGVDVLLDFYGRFTSVPLREFSFLAELGYSSSTSYSSYGEDKWTELELAGWTFLSQEESTRRAFDRNGLPYTVMTELRALERLPLEAQRARTMSMLTDDEIVSIALTALLGDERGLLKPALGVHYKRRHMSQGKNRSGWVVSFRLNVPAGFEPDMIDIEVYEDDLSTHIPPLI